jgi:peptidase YpeB-like protein
MLAPDNEREQEDHMRARWIALGVLTVALAGGATGVAYAATNGDSDTPLSGGTLQQASEAALAATGGGTVVDSETGDDGAAYGVEVRKPDGKQVEVSLDDKFKVVGQEADEDSPNEQG